MSAEAAPKFSVWLGDGWPGPYVVTYTLKRGRGRTIVVNGAATMGEACCIADAEYPMDSDLIESVSIVIGHVAEATHHVDTLSEFRARSEAMRAEIVSGSTNT